SLKSTFKTPNGRIVFDGGGIEPDVTTNPMEAHALTQVLFEKGYLFDFATEYCHKLKEPVDSKNFRLPDEVYSQFVNFMRGKDYTYKTQAETEIEQFIEEAKKERYFDEIKPQVEQVYKRITDNKKNDLI